MSGFISKFLAKIGLQSKKKETEKIPEKMKPSDNYYIPEAAQVKEPAYHVKTPNHAPNHVKIPQHKVRQIRVFISSTFRDMQDERDILIKKIFPQLRKLCEERAVTWTEVDLRWGITTEEAAEGKVLPLCLAEIHRCRPYFIGLLGERYGWVPPKYEVPDEEHYDWVREFEPGHSITAMEIYHGVLRNPAMTMRAFFYFRDPAFFTKVPEEHCVVFLPESEESAEKLKMLKDDIRKHCPVFDYPCAFCGVSEDGKVMLTDLEAFGQRVLEDLWSAIEMEYPVPVPELQPDELAIERAYHEAFIEGRCQRFIGRRDLIEQMTAYADGENNIPLVVTGAPGCGKSALLANFARAYATTHSDVFVLPHFIGISPGSTDIRRTLLRLCRELAQRFGIADEIPEDYEKLRGVFTKFLEQAASQGKVLLILDALNQVDESYYAHTLNWLPYTLPKNLRLIVSTLEGDCLEALHRRRPAPPEITMGPLAPEDRRQIIRQTLWDYRKRLDERPEKDQMGLLLSKGESNNPLYLIVACEELRVFGEFERVTERIKSLPGDVPMLFEQVLERLEHDHGKELVKSTLSLLACARHGLLETEMLELLRREGEGQLPRAIWARLYRSLQFYLRPPGERGEGALDFFHRQLAKAVRQMYLKHEEEIAGHRRLAEYFKCKADPTGDAMWKGNYPRGLSEMQYHQCSAQMWPELERMLTDLRFIETKCRNGMTYDMVRDYSISLDHWPGYRKHDPFGPSTPRIPIWASERVEAVLAGRLIPHMGKGTGPVLEKLQKLKDSQLSTRENVKELKPGDWPIDDVAEKVISVIRSGEIKLENMEVDHEFAGSQRVEAFASFVFANAHIISTMPEATPYRALNYASTGPVTSTAWQQLHESTLNDRSRFLSQPPPFVQKSALLRTLVGHRGRVTAVSLSADGRLAVSGDRQGLVCVWDVTTGECTQVFECRASVVATCLGYSETILAVATQDGRVLLWDQKSWEACGSLRVTGATICSMALTATDEMLIAGSADGHLEVWDVPGRRFVCNIDASVQQLRTLAVTVDGCLAVSGGDDGKLRLWDVTQGICVTELVGHRQRIRCVWVSPDGRFAASGSDDWTVRIWDIGAKTCIRVLEGHTSGVISVACSHMGRLVISAGRWDRNLLVWDAARMSCLQALADDSDSITCSSLATSSGGIAIAGYESGLLRVWDIVRPADTTAAAAKREVS
ncbi:MAG: DUF4062 domain-containing protein [Candidatus Methanoperedens sp.]|nr:DUF4062 domain-containing protein [Candidatus Methanoperedens sp.]